MNRGALSFWTHGAKVIEYYFIIENSMKSKPKV
jgi:hypothetical protein